MTAPRARRKPVSAEAGLNEYKRRQLLIGFCLPGQAYGRDPTGEALEQMRADWIQYRDELLAEWIAEHPGTRPYGFWKFDAPARRETTDGSVHPFDRPARQAKAAKCSAQCPGQRHDDRYFELSYGRPSIIDGEGMVRYETELQYLTRLDLLTQAEKEIA